MKEKVHIFFQKHGIETPDIVYVIRSDRKTVVHLEDGRAEGTYIALKDLFSVLPEDEFLHINKGTVVSKSHVVNVDRGVYLMSDGTSFQGRMRTPGEHSRNGAMVSNFRDKR
ncbi:MAG: LytTR family DNA-binding domain-containing protein, partial [Candidatus Methanomethylophilaceae archaeon]